MKTFAEAFRQALGTESVNAFAKRIGRPQPTVARWHSGENEPKLTDLQAVLAGLGKDLKWLQKQQLGKSNLPNSAQ